MKGSDEQPIKDILKELISGYQLGDGLLSIRINESWERIVGKIIAKHTLKVVIKETTLYIQLDSASLRAELSFSKEKIIRSANKILDSEIIKEIVFL